MDGQAPQGPYGEAPRGPRDCALVRLHDSVGRLRGTGFAADHHGTVVTSHEAVDGAARLVVTDAGGRRCAVTADAVTPLPHLDLALVRTEGLGAEPLPVTVRDRIEPGAYVRIAAGGWREARVLGAAPATYAAAGRRHLLEGAVELAIGTAGCDALRTGGGASGGPVLDAATGAVLGVLGTALGSAHRDVGFAAPLRPQEGAPAAEGPLAALLAENAATVPAYGADLNLAGVLALTATSVGQDGPPPAPRGPGAVVPVERAASAAEFAAFEAGPAAVLALVGPPGSGRTTELAALAARRGRGPAPAPTLWLRGADLHDDDTSVADAARRALDRAARIVAASRTTPPADLGDTTPDRLARLAHEAGRPLLLLLDSPEEMPPVLSHRLSDWTTGTADWLRRTGARLVVACRAEYWEVAGAALPGDLLYGATSGGEETRAPAAGPAARAGLPACVPLGDLDAAEARRARRCYGIPDGALGDRDACHPLTLRLLSEVRAALPGGGGQRVDRYDVFAAHLDLMCLRVAVRLAAQNGLRGTAVRRLAAKVAGQVHEAARRSLGPGQGALDRAAFEAVFPWGPAPARLGGGTGWASAVLAEGLLVPAGSGYRFAHEELADWLQGTHLDLDEALRVLVHRRRTPGAAHPLPVPHHRIGPVVQALLLLSRQYGPDRLAARLEELVLALDTDPESWWATRLLAEVLPRLTDAAPCARSLRLLADRLVARREREGRPVPEEFGPAFWMALPLPEGVRCELLRALVRADGPPDETGPRFLDATARLLAARPAAVQPHLVRWFDDERPLPATPHATVGTAAQALLHTHRHRALDDLTEALAGSAHPRAAELLAVLAQEEPSAVCRAVDRWAHDERPERRAAALTHGLRAAPHATSEADRMLLRYAALALLARPADHALHGGALALLVRDPHTRARHLPQALRHFAAGDPLFPPGALAGALVTHPDPVLDAFRDRLRLPGAGPALRTLADITTPGLARRVAALVRETVERRPETAGDVAAHVDRRLDQGPAVRAVLLPLVGTLLDDGPEPVRAALAGVVGAPGAPASRPVRRELRETLLAREDEPAVLDALLRAAAGHDGEDLRDLVHRTALRLARTPRGATRLDLALADLSRHVPGFAARLAGWLTDAPGDWPALVGPSTRRAIENLAGVRVPA
ncbi:serine protease [Streptomyces sp. DH24]|uniref:S1 family peptidase n=1 Tax=Streptomyces sp. DH24 TaxID=3040123 RepID=UPI00244228AA|nr:serine protease [Streptomyces sp. DH24]MDG9720095.1 trypsin-like peptidase domain-containing protein [Streptomyces sp. DH24]